VTRTHSPRTHPTPTLSYCPPLDSSLEATGSTGKSADHGSAALIPSTPSRDFQSLLLPPTIEGITASAKIIQGGGILAFPTETVYGLGADARNPTAIKKVFQAKGRPLTDPLIVHVAKSEDGRKLLNFDGGDDSEGSQVFELLSRQFWPGALTIIGRGAEDLPPMLMANTGFVGVRCPSHPLAQALLNAAGCPVAAPSANRFGHVSPTMAKHVLADLGDRGVKVLNGEDKREAFMVKPCEFGIESTVVKIEEETKKVIVLRRGAISVQQLKKCLRGEITRSVPSSPLKFGTSADENNRIKIDEAALKKWELNLVTNNHHEMPKLSEEDENGAEDYDNVNEQPRKKRRKLSNGTSGLSTNDSSAPSTPPLAQNGNGNGSRDSSSVSDPSPLKVVCGVGHVAPGQLITHYAPDGLVCCIVSCEKSGEAGKEGLLEKKTVVLDFNGHLAQRGLTIDNENVVAYKDLSVKGSVAEASKNLFAYLRWSETFNESAERLFLADVGVLMAQDDDVGGIEDRMFRAASGKRVQL